jgi:hypothetical protein
MWTDLGTGVAGSVNGKSAGDGVVIGGLRCQACGTLYAPDGRTTSEVCALCHLHLAYRERFPRLDIIRRERAR